MEKEILKESMVEEQTEMEPKVISYKVYSIFKGIASALSDLEKDIDQAERNILAVEGKLDEIIVKDCKSILSALGEAAATNRNKIVVDILDELTR